MISALALGAALAGAAWGLLADRLAARWPAHEGGAVRAVDWRTAVVVGVGTASFAGVGMRFSGASELLLFWSYVAVLLVLLATDLDQRLLPNLLTYPLAGAALVLGVAGLNPLVSGQMVPAAVGAIAAPAVMLLLSIPFGRGAIGLGDLKLLVGVGLFAGLYRVFAGIVVGALLAGIVILVLLAFRRVTLKSFIPFGPFLIIGAIWALLAPT